MHFSLNVQTCWNTAAVNTLSLWVMQSPTPTIGNKYVNLFWPLITAPWHNLCDKSQSTAEECIITPTPATISSGMWWIYIWTDRQTDTWRVRPLKSDITHTCIKGWSNLSARITSNNQSNLENAVTQWRDTSPSQFLSKSIQRLIAHELQATKGTNEI